MSYTILSQGDTTVEYDSWLEYISVPLEHLPNYSNGPILVAYTRPDEEILIAARFVNIDERTSSVWGRIEFFQKYVINPPTGEGCKLAIKEDKDAVVVKTMREVWLR